MYKTWIIIRYSVALQVDYKVKEKMRQARLLQYYLYVKITLLLTITYICGAIARLTHYNVAWISFNVEHSLQGLLVAIAVTCNCQILKIYAKSIRRRRRKRENLIEVCKFKKRTRDISRSTSLETLSWQPELLSVWSGHRQATELKTSYNILHYNVCFPLNFKRKEKSLYRVNMKI